MTKKPGLWRTEDQQPRLTCRTETSRPILSQPAASIYNGPDVRALPKGELPRS